MKILKKEEILPKLEKIFVETEKDLKIVSAWIKGDILKQLLNLVKEDVNIQIIIRASSYEDLKITDPEVFKIIKEKKGKIYLNPNLHSKFIISDNKKAVIGSANITNSGLLIDGNIETAVYTSEESKIKELLNIFEDIKSVSYDFSKTVAFVASLDTTREGTALILDDIQEQTYVRIPLEDGNFFLGRIFDIKSINLAFSNIKEEDNIKDSKILNIFSNNEKDWIKSAVFALSKEGVRIKLAKFEILGEYEKERNLFKTPVRPVEAGLPIEVLEVEEKELKAILLKNHSGYDMKFPTYLGKLQGTDVKAYLDMDKVISMHMAVLGTTGSGKTTFVKKILKNFDKPAKIFIFDMYGEYYEELKESKNIKNIQLPNILFPLDVNDMKDILKEAGLTLRESSKDEKKLMAFFRRNLKPELDRTALREINLKDLIYKASDQIEDRFIKLLLLDIVSFWERNYGKESVEYQPLAIKMLEESLKTKERIVIYNYKNIDIAETRINIAGLIMREILKLAKDKVEDRIIVLEEAHNFAPEKGTSEIPSGRENLAYINAKKIAMEGRKLRLGLVAITQRPANISKFILSQLNTQVIFKLITKNDLDAISIFFEQSKEDIFELLPFLKPGTAYIGGLAVPFSFLFQMEEIPYW